MVYVSLVPRLNLLSMWEKSLVTQIIQPNLKYMMYRDARTMSLFSNSYALVTIRGNKLVIFPSIVVLLWQ